MLESSVAIHNSVYFLS